MDMDQLYTRRNWLGAAVGAAALALTGQTLAACAPAPVAKPGPQMTVYKSPTCGCCRAWVDHARDAGFSMAVQDMPNVDPIKQQHGVPAELASCHTALVDGYVIEGHVPADLVHRLLRERPQAVGLAVPGMPMGSPGMEGLTKDPYDVLLFDRAGKTTVFASR